MRLVLRLASISALFLAQSWTAPPSTFPTANSVDALIAAAIGEGKIPGAVLIVGHDGHIVYRKAYGKRALAPASEAMTLDTIFDCASLTKVVATTPSVMKLFEEGRIRVSDKVTEYIPEFQNGKSDITIRDLMTHYSGLRPDLDLDPPWSGYETGIRKAVDDPPAGPRGTKFVYSDINFILMGEIVHRVSGQTLDEYARTHVFEPLGMNDTRFRPGQALFPRIAPTERLKTGEILRGVVDDPTTRYMGGVAGHAGMFSTADDLALYCQMMLNKGVNPPADATHPARLFSPLTVDLFTSPQSPPGLAAVRGLGWDINSPFSGNRGELFPVGTSYGHTGFTGTSLWIDPASQTYVVLLTNAIHPVIQKPITPLRKSVATAVAVGVGYSPNVSKHVRTGLDVLEDEHFRSLAGKRVGLITNQTGVDRTGRRNVDVMVAGGVRITALLSPEHGILVFEDKTDVAGGVDKSTGIRIYSIFSEKSKRPTPEMLRNVDVVVFDIADIGTRFYTYVTTMAYAMEECAHEGKPFVVLDRPNPITGLHVEGPVLDPDNASFVGYFPMPVRHGMTVGEMAKMFNAENNIRAALTVVPMLGWTRSDWFDNIGLPWVDPSPNMRSLNAATLYPALGILEYSENYSVGRGTPQPFEAIGAKWIDGPALAVYLNNRQIPGVRVYPVKFRPDESHYARVTIDGVRFDVINRDIFDSGRLGLELADALQKAISNENSAGGKSTADRK
jgi:uncharacterized protein YbbC (DUF1343 family)